MTRQRQRESSRYNSNQRNRTLSQIAKATAHPLSRLPTLPTQTSSFLPSHTHMDHFIEEKAANDTRNKQMFVGKKEVETKRGG